MANFQDILSKSGVSKTPKALPVGTYLAIVDGMPVIGKIGKNQTDVCEFNLKPMQPQADVDQTALVEALDGKALTEKKIRHRLFLTEDSVWRLDQFLYHLGLVEKDNDGNYVLPKSRGELINETMGKQVLVSMGHRPSDDGTQIFPEVKSTAKV